MSLSDFVSGSVFTERKVPIAVVSAQPAYGVLGSVVKLSGGQSYDPGELPGKAGALPETTRGTNLVDLPGAQITREETGRTLRLSGVDAGSYRIIEVISPTRVAVSASTGGAVVFAGGIGESWTTVDDLTYAWEFLAVPIGSKARLEGFRKLDGDGSLVSFSPDVVGEYIVGLTASNGVFASKQVTTRVSIRALLVPHGRGLVPDGKFIWSYLHDVWQEVEGRELFEEFWSALIQIAGAELLKLYQNDFAKSIRDIQDLYQRRWLSYEPRLEVSPDDASFFLGNSCAGLGGTTVGLGVGGSEQCSGFAVPYYASNNLAALATGRLVVFGGRGYTILRSNITSGSVPMVYVATDGGALLADQSGLAWRAGGTLVSKTQNFEELGVSAGDVLIVEVANDNSGTSVEVGVQVIGVDRNRLGFVLSKEPLTLGAVPAVSNELYTALTNGFDISGLSKGANGALQFSGDAKTLLDYFSSGVFKRAFWNKELTPNDTINAFGGIFRLRPRAIIRNSKLPVDEDLRSIPLLQEWLVQPATAIRDGKVYQVSGGQEFELERAPLSLIENSDFIIDDKTVYEGQMTFKTGTSVLSVEEGHFIDRNLQPGDSFTILEPAALKDTLYIASVLSSDELQLNKPIKQYALGDYATAHVALRRRASGRFLRFIPGGFTPKNPAPSRLWAEVSFFDNGQTVEDNFGILVGLKRSDLEAISSTVQYRQAVAGLMFAYSRGPVVNKIRLGAQILMGLPFAEHRGIVRSIEGDYRLDDAGSPVQGRILIEDTDSVGQPTGMMRVYLYPIDKASELAGLDVNPETGELYAVGDSVEMFASLSKGVEASDYLMRSDAAASPIAKLQQFHTLQLRANDSLFSLDELGLVSSFLRKITPSYVALTILTASEHEDQAPVTDALHLKLRTIPLIDHPAACAPVPVAFDSINLSGVPHASFEDGFYSVRMSGGDLVTAYGVETPSSVAARAAGGFITPAAGETPVVREGDYLVIFDGPNRGIYPTTSVESDLQIAVSGTAASGFQTATQRFAVLRPLAAKLRGGTATSVGSIITCSEAGLTADGVAPGDAFVSLGERYLVTRVGPAAALDDNPELAAGQLQLASAPPSLEGAAYRIYRMALMEGPFSEGAAITSDGTKYVAFDNPFLQALTDPGDELVCGNASRTRLQVIDPANLVLRPVLAAGVYTVRLIKRGHSASPVPGDFLERFAPEDSIDIALSNPAANSASFASGSTDITLGIDPAAFGFKSGDLLELVDRGTYPVVDLLANGVRLGSPMPATSTAAWKLIRRR